MSIKPLFKMNDGQHHSYYNDVKQDFTPQKWSESLVHKIIDPWGTAKKTHTVGLIILSALVIVATLGFGAFLIKKVIQDLDSYQDRVHCFVRAYTLFATGRQSLEFGYEEVFELRGLPLSKMHLKRVEIEYRKKDLDDWYERTRSPAILCQLAKKLIIEFTLRHNESLSLSNCHLYDLPESLGELPNLKKLHLMTNNLSSLPAGFKDLEELDLADNHVNSKEALCRLAAIPNLKRLGLSCNNIREFPYKKFPYLEALDLRGNPLSEENIKAIRAYYGDNKKIELLLPELSPPPPPPKPAPFYKKKEAYDIPPPFSGVPFFSNERPFSDIPFASFFAAFFGGFGGDEPRSGERSYADGSKIPPRAPSPPEAVPTFPYTDTQLDELKSPFHEVLDAYLALLKQAKNEGNKDLLLSRHKGMSVEKALVKVRRDVHPDRYKSDERLHEKANWISGTVGAICDLIKGEK